MTTPSSANAVVLDSLPYIDQIHEDYEDYALALVEAEMKNSAAPPCKKMPDLNFRTPLLRSEYEARAGDEDMAPRDPKTQPESKKRKMPPTVESLSNEDLPRARVRYETERLRGLALEVRKQVLAEIWKSQISETPGSAQSLHKIWTDALDQQRVQVEEVNYRRQQFQQRLAGPQMEDLNQKRHETEYKVKKLRESQQAATN